MTIKGLNGYNKIKKATPGFILKPEVRSLFYCNLMVSSHPPSHSNYQSNSFSNELTTKILLHHQI